MLMIELPANEYEKFLEECVKHKETVLRQDKEIKRLKKEICELKKQLEEKEATIKMLKQIERYDIGEMLIENTKLKQQLAESEKEIERLKKLTKKLNHEAQTYYEDAYCNDFQTKHANK